MNNKTKRKLNLAIKNRDEKTFLDVCYRLIDTDKSDSLMDYITSNSNPDFDWAFNTLFGDKAELVKEKAMSVIHKSLSENNLTLGEDYSVYNKGLLINQKTKEIMLAHLPENERNYFKRNFTEINQKSPEYLLEEHLQVPFFNNLRTIVLNRILTWEDINKITYYIGYMSYGFTARNPQIPLLEYILTWVIEAAPNIGRYVIKKIEGMGDIDYGKELNQMIMLDLISAGGGTQYISTGELEFEDSKNSFGIKIEGLKIYDKLWLGDSGTVAELICELEKRMQNLN